MVDYQEVHGQKLETQQRQMTELLAVLLLRQVQRMSEVNFTIFHKS